MDMKQPMMKSPITAMPGGSSERPRLTVLFPPPAAETLPEKAPATRKIRHMVMMLSSPTPLAMMEIFSLKLMPTAALEIKNKLVQAYPDKKDVFEKNYNAFLEELAKEKENLDKKMASKTKKAYMIYHPALNYFIKDYNVEEVSVEYEGKEPTAQQIKEIIDEAKEHSITTILVQPQFPKQSIEIIAKEIPNAKIVEFNVDKENVFENLKQFVDYLD